MNPVGDRHFEDEVSTVRENQCDEVFLFPNQWLALLPSTVGLS